LRNLKKEGKEEEVGKEAKEGKEEQKPQLGLLHMPPQPGAGAGEVASAGGEFTNLLSRFLNSQTTF
jgi:hypothetical protein